MIFLAIAARSELAGFDLFSTDTVIALSTLPVLVGCSIVLLVVLPLSVERVIEKIHEQQWPPGAVLRGVAYFLFGVLPAIYVCYLAFAGADSETAQAWRLKGLAGAGTAGLCMAIFSDPTRRDLFNLVISGLLIAGLVAIAPMTFMMVASIGAVARNWVHLTPAALILFFISIFITPVVVALHFLCKQLQTWMARA